MKNALLHKSDSLYIFSASTSVNLNLPLIGGSVSAGFPSPADDFVESGIDLNKEFIKHPATTFYAKVRGNSMQDMGINEGDLLIVDRSLPAKDGKVAVCYIDGDFTVKKIKIEQDCCWLIPANEKYKPIKVTKENEFLIWGIVTNVIKSL